MKDISTGRATFHLPTLLRLLRGIDRLPRGATGALVFASTDAPQGTVLIEDNRVCWAAASEMEARLTDILRHQSDPPLPAEVFEAIYEKCYRDKTPLGETLVEEGVVTREGLWHALRQHTAEAIALLATAEEIHPVWASNRARRYDAQYTFSTVELLTSVGSFGREELAREGDETLQRITPQNTIGIAFPVNGSGLPLAQAKADTWHCQALFELCAWAREAIGSDKQEAEALVESETSRVLKQAWRSGELVYVHCTGAPAQMEPSFSKEGAIAGFMER